jgi:hypothetical protein
MLPANGPGLSALVLSAVSALAMAGCSLDMDLTPATTGSQGKLQFQYVSNACSLGRCGVERSVVQGALAAVSIEGSDGSVRMIARLAGDPVGRISEQTESCRCAGGGSDSRGVEPGSTCGSQQTKSCTMAVDIETSQIGDAKLEIVDPAGKLIDSAPIHVHGAARIDLDVREGASRVGFVYEVKQGYKVKLAARVFDADGTELLFTKHGVAHVYGDRDLLMPDAAVLIGSSDVEDMIAGTKTGETAVTVTAPGASSVARFRVVP